MARPLGHLERGGAGAEAVVGEPGPDLWVGTGDEQTLDELQIAGRRRHVERRQSVAVGDGRVRAGRQQHQRGQAVVRLGSPEKGRSLLLVAQVDVGATALEEELEQRRHAERGGVPNRRLLPFVVLLVRVGSCVQQERRDLHVVRPQPVLLGGLDQEVQRAKATWPACLGIGAALQQEEHGRASRSSDRREQGCPPPGVGGVDVQAGAEPLLEHVVEAVVCRGQEGVEIQGSA